MEDLHRQQLHQHDDAVRNLEAELSETREAAERSGREARVRAGNAYGHAYGIHIRPNMTN